MARTSTNNIISFVIVLLLTCTDVGLLPLTIA